LCVNHFSYVPFISAKLSILVKNTLTFTTLLMSLPAAFKTAERFWIQSSVISLILEEGRVRISPVEVQGIWPEQ